MLISCSASQGLSQYNLYVVLVSEVMWLLWEEKVLIREIWLNIYLLTEMLNSNRKWIPQLLLHLLDYF